MIPTFYIPMKWYVRWPLRALFFIGDTIDRIIWWRR